jgi:hypothetical protein
MKGATMSPFDGVSTALLLVEFTATPQLFVVTPPDFTESEVPVGERRTRQKFDGPRPPVARLRTTAESRPMIELNIVLMRFSTTIDTN